MNLEGLNDRQREAVLHTGGALLVLAGAGTGKTRVLTYRIAYLIEALNVYPSQILALTFTNKAAKEMKLRVEKLLGQRADYMWIGTFHSICVRILRQNASELGYTSDFAIYDTLDQKSLIKSAMKSLNINDKDLKIAFVKARISEAKNESMSPAVYRDTYVDDYQLKQVAKIYEVYQREMIKNNAMDFDDLLINTLMLFKKSEDILTHYQAKFKYLHVDEYQDTNAIQYQLIKKLSQKNGNLCVVGDNDQSIYGWRGADIRNIEDFDRDFVNAKIIMLEQNYRSTKNILAAANGVIKNNALRRDKKLWTENATGEAIQYYKAQDNNDEAYFVAKQIIDGFESGDSYADYAVLYRTNAQSRSFEEAFIRAAIPYKIIGGHKFYERLEIKDLLAYLKVIANENDEVSLLRIINVPRRGIGGKTIERLQAIAVSRQVNLYRAIEYVVANDALSKKAIKGLQNFLNTVSPYIDRQDKLRGSQILEEILDKTGYRIELEMERTPEANSRIENIDELMSQIMNYEQANEIGDLQSYLQEISLLSDQDEIAESESGHVLLMTIHAAKGLEFKNVFLVGLEERLFPSQLALESDMGLDEERRLCYVGITRAERKLYLTHASLRIRFGRTEVNPMSRFIEEIPVSTIYSHSGALGSSKPQRLDFGYAPQIKQYSDYSNARDNSEYKTGLRVYHEKFGEGMIVSIKNNDFLVVAFDKKGVKQLSAGLAPLKIVK